MFRRMAGTAIVAVMVLGGGNAASGGEVTAGGSIELSKSSVEPGEIFQASNAAGSECIGAIVIGDFTARPGAWSTVPDESGDWSVDLEVPPNGPPSPTGEPTPFPPGEYDVHARCEATCPDGWESQCGPTAAGANAAAVRGAGPGPESFQYEPATVTVVATGDPDPETPTNGSPTSTPDTPGTTPTTPAGGAVRSADAAAPVAAQPTFTG